MYRIDEIMENYLKDKKAIEEISDHDNLIVDFDITYTDGRNKCFTVNSEGEHIEDEEEVVEDQGEITVFSTIKSKDGTKIRGVKVNLYEINGITPKLVQSLETDYDGKVVFSNIPNGNYRIIQLIDKRYFDKPTYIGWNEVKIDSENTKDTIYAINYIKKMGSKYK